MAGAPQAGDWRISAILTRRSDLASKALGGIRWDKAEGESSAEKRERREPDECCHVIQDRLIIHA